VPVDPRDCITKDGAVLEQVEPILACSLPCPVKRKQMAEV